MTAPAITDIHRLAYERVEEIRDMPSFAEAWAEIRKLLPSDLTNPQPELPTEPGRYVDRNGDDEWLLHDDGRWFHSESIVVGTQLHTVGPFRRLVPERPQITREQIADHLAACSELPRLSNLDMADSILALVNGADQ